MAISIFSGFVIAVIYTEHFIQSIKALNAFVFHRAVLRYQQDIIDQGNFSLISPWTGERIAPNVCHILNVGIAYRIDCQHPIWLLAGDIKNGFPITEAYLPSLDISIWTLNDLYREGNGPWKTVLSQIEPVAPSYQISEVQQTDSFVLVGHPNFAHHLWNELPALYSLLKIGTSRAKTLHIKAINSPLAPLEQIATGDLVSVEKITRFQELMGFQDKMATRLGATQIPVDLREKIAGILCKNRDRKLTDPAENALLNCNPVIWLSVRLDARTADNQNEFLRKLITKIAKNYPRAGFILDGFSYPDDFSRPIYREVHVAGAWRSILNKSGQKDVSLASIMTLREQEVSAFTHELKSSFKQLLPNVIVDTSGMSLANAIYLGRFANYYVCHAGTLQHKIAWIYNIDGLVHSNTTDIRKGAQRWLADQLQDGVKPSLMSIDYTKNLDEIRTTNKVERNRDYHIIDIEGAVEQILDDLQISRDRHNPPDPPHGCTR